jgi:type IV secretory pathway VirB9-like protein
MSFIRSTFAFIVLYVVAEAAAAEAAAAEAAAAEPAAAEPAAEPAAAASLLLQFWLWK